MPNLSPELLDVVAFLEARKESLGDSAMRLFAEGQIRDCDRAAGAMWELRRLIDELATGVHVGAYEANSVAIGAHERAQNGEG